MSRPIDRPPTTQKPIKLLRKKLDAAGVEAHFDSVASQAQAVEVRIKGAAEGYSSADTAQLEETGRRLRAGDIAAVQLRFFQDDAWWCDTVMRVKESYRLVRMRQSDPAAD
jgi:hypothetical protein